MGANTHVCVARRQGAPLAVSDIITLPGCLVCVSEAVPEVLLLCGCKAQQGV